VTEKPAFMSNVNHNQ